MSDNLRIVSDGSPEGTKITNAKTGEEIPGSITAVDIRIEGGTGATATLTFFRPQVDVIAKEG